MEAVFLCGEKVYRLVYVSALLLGIVQVVPSEV